MACSKSKRQPLVDMCWNLYPFPCRRCQCFKKSTFQRNTCRRLSTIPSITHVNIKAQVTIWNINICVYQLIVKQNITLMPQTSDNNVFFLHVFIEKSPNLINLLLHGSRSHKTHGRTDYLKETWWLFFIYLFFRGPLNTIIPESHLCVFKQSSTIPWIKLR